MKSIKKIINNEKGMEFITVFALLAISLVLGGIIWTTTDETLTAMVSDMAEELNEMFI